VIDRRARNIAANAIRDFMEGTISNREYERRYPRSKDDHALWEIYVQMWFLYSDLKEHTLTGEYALKEESRSFLDRCILFLKSDLDFQWPRQKFRPWYGLFRIIGLGRFIDRLERKEMNIGDVDVWPFLKKTEYEEVANCRPK
jgi:hypothetical protein